MSLKVVNTRTLRLARPSLSTVGFSALRRISCLISFSLPSLSGVTTGYLLAGFVQNGPVPQQIFPPAVQVQLAEVIGAPGPVHEELLVVFVLVGQHLRRTSTGVCCVVWNWSMRSKRASIFVTVRPRVKVSE